MNPLYRILEHLFDRVHDRLDILEALVSHHTPVEFIDDLSEQVSAHDMILSPDPDPQYLGDSLGYGKYGPAWRYIKEGMTPQEAWRKVIEDQKK